MRISLPVCNGNLFIVNTSRGEVIETLALLDALKTGRIRDAVIDTWENEPDIHPDLLQKVFWEPLI